MGKISSMRRQYMRKARDVQPPMAATISGGTPANRSSTAPPILKLCPRTWARCADIQIEVTKVRKSCLSMFLVLPDEVWYANKADVGGALELMSRWFRKAVHG